MPATVAEIPKIEPVYECMPGWTTETFGIPNYEDLPAKANAYIAFLGPEPASKSAASPPPPNNQTIVGPGSGFAELVDCIGPL